jgi:hypothetical protein
MGKSTISMVMFNSYFDIPRRYHNPWGNPILNIKAQTQGFEHSEHADRERQMSKRVVEHCSFHHGKTRKQWT